MFHYGKLILIVFCVSSLFINAMAQSTVFVVGAGLTSFNVDNFNTGFNINTAILGMPNRYLALGGMLAFHSVSKNEQNITEIDYYGNYYPSVTKKTVQADIIETAPLIRLIIPVSPEFGFHIEAGPHFWIGFVPSESDETKGFWGLTIGAGFSLYQLQITPQYRISYNLDSSLSWWSVNIGYNFISKKEKSFQEITG